MARVNAAKIALVDLFGSPRCEFIETTAAALFT